MIFGAFERMVAMRYLRARRQEGFVSVIAGFSLLGIALGVATLIIVMSVMNGFRHELLSRILGLNGHLAVYAELGPVLDYDVLAKRIAEVKGVAQATPTVEGQVMATAHGGATGALVRGVRPEDLARRTVVAGHIVAGSLDHFQGDDAILVGSRLAQRFGLGIGSQLTLISPQGNPTAFGTVPRIRDYTIVGYYTTKIGLESIGYPGLRIAWPTMPSCPHPNDPEHLHLREPGVNHRALNHTVRGEQRS